MGTRTKTFIEASFVLLWLGKVLSYPSPREWICKLFMEICHRILYST